MKQKRYSPCLAKLFIPAIALTITSCNQQEKDRHIKADITAKAKEDVHFTGVHFTVENGNVTLWGICPTPESKAAVKQKLNTIHVIKSIDDRLLIAPLSIGSSFTKKQQVDSVLASYPTVTAEVAEHSVNLIGKVKQKDLNKLLNSIGKVSTDTIRIDQLVTSI